MNGRRLRRLAPMLLPALAACEVDAPVATVSDPDRFLEADAIVMGGVTTISNADGIRTARLQFDTAYQWNDSTHQALRGVNLIVFNDDGSERATVTSLRGTFEPLAERLTARGEVVLVVPFQDRRLETEELHYDPELNQLWSDSAFVMNEEGGQREGSSFRSDLEFRDFVVQGSAGTGP